MITLITGSSHSGKTRCAQQLLERDHHPYLSIDHLKMGLIRSGLMKETADAPDEKLTPELWRVTKEIIKTALENKQHLIVEGCYIPFDWQKDFEPEQLEEIKFLCLIMSREYIEDEFETIKKHANVIEQRITDDNMTIDYLIAENTRYLLGCQEYDLEYIWIDDEYKHELSWK